MPKPKAPTTDDLMTRVQELQESFRLGFRQAGTTRESRGDFYIPDVLRLLKDVVRNQKVLEAKLNRLDAQSLPDLPRLDDIAHPVKRGM